MAKPAAVATAPRTNIDFEKFRLKNFIESLGPDELEIHEEQVDLVDIAAIMEGNKKAVLFKKAGPEGSTLVGNVASGRSRLAKAFGVAPENLLKEVLRRLETNKAEMIEVSQSVAPCQEVVLKGKDADLTKLPIHVQHGLDGGPYISSSVDYVVDTKTGLMNSGMRRLMLRGRHETGVDLVAPSDLRAIYIAQASKGEKVPVSFVVGSHPIDHVSATMRIPVDELGLVATLRGEPMPVVKCVTNDIKVPADAEYVIEGYFDEKGHVEPEGPYGEFLGYYGGVKKNPLFHVTAITHRKDALFQTSTISGKALGDTDTSQLNALRSETIVWRALETAVREVTAVYIPAACGGMLNVRIAMKQRVPGEARNAISAAMGCLANCKNVFVVDPDIDIYSDQQMEWALATRFQPERDLTVVAGFRGNPLDPSTEGSKFSSKAGYDLTRSAAAMAKIEAIVPAAPRWEGKKFPSVRAALEDGPKFFYELMVAVGSRDGREIALEVDKVRQEGKLGRNEDGRYVFGPGNVT
jgi:2,5-furandicarboxylate decarboxylase 1